MKWEDLRFSVKELLAICAMVLTVGLAWADLRYDVADVKKEVRLLRGTVQWLLGEAIKEGWVPPGGWILPEDE